jgi:hypothetical protein
MAITTTTDHTPGDRYRYDLNLPGDFAQLDTSEDASHYGNWASAQRRILFSYCEGDCTTTVCETIEEFKAEIDKFLAFCKRIGYEFLGIDPGFSHTEEILQPWRDCGLSHLIH